MLRKNGLEKSYLTQTLVRIQLLAVLYNCFNSTTTSCDCARRVNALHILPIFIHFLLAKAQSTTSRPTQTNPGQCLANDSIIPAGLPPDEHHTDGLLLFRQWFRRRLITQPEFDMSLESILRFTREHHFLVSFNYGRTPGSLCCCCRRSNCPFLLLQPDYVPVPGSEGALTITRRGITGEIRLVPDVNEAIGIIRFSQLQFGSTTLPWFEFRLPVCKQEAATQTE